MNRVAEGHPWRLADAATLLSLDFLSLGVGSICVDVELCDRPVLRGIAALVPSLVDHPWDAVAAAQH